MLLVIDIQDLRAPRIRRVVSIGEIGNLAVQVKLGLADRENRLYVGKYNCRLRGGGSVIWILDADRLVSPPEEGPPTEPYVTRERRLEHSCAGFRIQFSWEHFEEHCEWREILMTRDSRPIDSEEYHRQARSKELPYAYVEAKYLLTPRDGYEPMLDPPILLATRFGRLITSWSEARELVAGGRSFKIYTIDSGPASVCIGFFSEWKAVADDKLGALGGFICPRGPTLGKDVAIEYLPRIVVSD